MPQSVPSQPLRGIFWMLVTGLCFVAVTALVKYMGPRVPPAEAAFLRYVLGLVFLIPMIRPMLAARVSARQLRLFGIRGACHTAGVILWFFAMTRITIAEVTALNYLAPVYVTLGAVLFLGERVALRRILAVVAALVGALLILRPGFRELETGHFAMLLTAICFAGSYLSAKMLADQVSAAVVVGFLSVTVTIGLAPFAFAVWVPPSLSDLVLLFVVAIFATGGHYAMTLAFAAAPVTVTQPVTFLQLVWASLLGVLVFAEPLDGWVVAGGGIILAAVTYIAWRETMLKLEAAKTAPPG